MKRAVLLAMAVTGAMGAMAPTGVQAGRGSAVGAGLLGFGVGAIVGSALTPREVYVVPASAVLRSGWLCAATLESRLVQLLSERFYGPSFNPNTGYFQAANGGWYFCH